MEKKQQFTAKGLNKLWTLVVVKTVIKYTTSSLCSFTHSAPLHFFEFHWNLLNNYSNSIENLQLCIEIKGESWRPFHKKTFDRHYYYCKSFRHDKILEIEIGEFRGKSQFRERLAGKKDRREGNKGKRGKRI